MSSASSSVAEWFTRLEPAPPARDLVVRPDDPRLGEVIEHWSGDPAALRPGRTVLLGFPQEEGVVRNHGRPGAAEAPNAIRRALQRLTAWDGENDIDLSSQPPLDAGNLRLAGGLEETQQALGAVIAGILRSGAIPIVLGGGHETAYGHYLGYICPPRPFRGRGDGGEGGVGIINLDAHLDVRSCIDGKGHSGSPFRQALEHPTQPLPGTNYVCLGAQPYSVSRRHWLYCRERGCVVRWAGDVANSLEQHFLKEAARLEAAGCSIYVSIDADVVHAAEVPGVSAPNVTGLSGKEVLACARLAGQTKCVTSIDLVEINPRHDLDGRSSRWAALAVWHFLMGLTGRQ